MTDIDKLIAAVERMFDDHSFKRVTNCIWLHQAVIDGVKVGVVEATYYPNFGSFTLNCNEFRRGFDAKSSGRADAFYVAKTRFHAPIYKKQVVTVLEATAALEERLRNQEPRPGKYARSGPWMILTTRSSCSMSEFESHVPSYKDSKEEMVEVLSQDLFPWQDLDAFLDAIENEDWEISCYELRRLLWAIQHLRGRSGSRRRCKLKLGA
jgi:hypothetical protein